MIEARHSAAKARHAATSKTDRKRRVDEEGRRRRQVGRPLWDYRNGKCGWTHLDSLRAHELSRSLSRSICKSVQSTSSRGELPSRLSVHASHVHTRCQPRCRTSRAGAWRFINRYASPGKATTTAAINPFRAKLFFFQTPCTYTRTHLLRVKVARVTRGCCAKRVGYRLFACGISICVGCSLVQNMDLCRIIGLRGIWICMKYEFM